jgi:hypothetical protein
MISREYCSQKYLKNVEISYNILSGNTKERSLAGIYEITSGKEVKVEVTVLGETFQMSVTNE